MFEVYTKKQIHHLIFKVIYDKGKITPKKHGDYREYKVNGYRFVTDTYNKSIKVYFKDTYTYLGLDWGDYKSDLPISMFYIYYYTIIQRDIPYGMLDNLFDKEKI